MTLKMTTTTIHHRFLLAVLAIGPAIVAASYAWPVRAVLTQVEIASAFGLAAAGVLLAVGVCSVAAWWRGREEREDEREAWSMSNWTEAEQAKWCECFKHRNRRLIAALAEPPALQDGDYKVVGDEIHQIKNGVWSPVSKEQRDLSRYLTNAMTVLLRHPELTVDAGTLRMLSRHKERKAPARGPDGRWRRAE